MPTENAGLSPRAIRRRLVREGLSKDSEIARTILRWMLLSNPSLPPSLGTDPLDAAIKLGRNIFETFTNEFTQFFLDPGQKGSRYIHSAIRKRLGFSNEQLCDAVIDRISDRRQHLLESFFRKRQGSLFGPSRFDSAKLGGFFVQVARVESLHCPEGMLRQRNAAEFDFSRVAATDIRSAYEDADAATESDHDEHVKLAQLVSLLVDFWSSGNGFTKSQCLEGLVSVGLGSATGSAKIARRCRNHLRRRLVKWEEELQRKRRRASHRLERWEAVHEELAHCSDSGERARLESRQRELEAEFQRLEQQIAQHHFRLRPKPKEVAAILDGIVSRVGNHRHRRIHHENRILKRRAINTSPLNGSRPVRDEWQALMRAVANHINANIASPSAHGLDDAERERRQRLKDDWGAEGIGLLGQIRQHLAQLHSRAPHSPSVDEELAWLADAEDAYQFAILDCRGVLSGLAVRRGWRLRHLLRVDKGGAHR